MSILFGKLYLLGPNYAYYIKLPERFCLKFFWYQFMYMKTLCLDCIFWTPLLQFLLIFSENVVHIIH